MEKIENQSEGTGEHLDAVRTLHGWRWVVTCLAIYATALLYGLDTTIAAGKSLTRKARPLRSLYTVPHCSANV